MKKILTLILSCIALYPAYAHACLSKVWSGNLENTAFIGIAKIKYVQYEEDGTFREAGFTPFIAYKASKRLDLSQTIKIENDGSDDGHCFMRPFEIGKLVEVIILKEEGKNYTVFPPMFLEKLRKNARFVGGQE